MDFGDIAEKKDNPFAMSFHSRIDVHLLSWISFDTLPFGHCHWAGGRDVCMLEVGKGPEMQ